MCSVTRKTLGRGEKRGKRSLSNWLGPGGAVLGFNPFAGSDFLSVQETLEEKKRYKVQTGLSAECDSEHFMLWLLGSDKG